MKQNGKYECEHLKGEVLVAVKQHNQHQYNVQSEQTGRTFLVNTDVFSEPSLSLAHVANIYCHLTEIKEK